MHPIVIVGSGLGGYSTARELRKLNREVPLHIITADGGEFYSKPTLSNALAAKKVPAAIPLNTAEQMASQLNATVRTRTRITAIDPALRRIRIGEETIAYSKLVLALGADQVRLPLQGDAVDTVMTVNSLDDYARFRSALEGKRRVAIIGAGLIGCEFANDLAATGYEVECVDIAAQPLPRLLLVAGGAMLQEKLAALGVKWHLGTSVSAVDRAGGAVAVTLASGATLEADIVLSAIGLKPKLEMAQAAGLAVRGGIIVDRFLACGADDVYALGDCAEVAGMVLPFVMPIMHAARALAATLADKRTAVSYPAMPVLVKTPACPTIVAPPPSGAAGEWLIERSGEGVKSLFIDSAGKLLGFALNGTATAERAKLARELPALLA
ncbi:MAG TPA: FAD-dependent oxidoreductase [Burkholderiales bacterium]|nr:FAD-dependent oxidoreductase [Burkholderiales bacterium]